MSALKFELPQSTLCLPTVSSSEEEETTLLLLLFSILVPDQSLDLLLLLATETLEALLSCSFKSCKRTVGPGLAVAMAVLSHVRSAFARLLLLLSSSLS
jgi:hypothetical protein